MRSNTVGTLRASRDTACIARVAADTDATGESRAGHHCVCHLVWHFRLDTFAVRRLGNRRGQRRSELSMVLCWNDCLSPVVYHDAVRRRVIVVTLKVTDGRGAETSATLSVTLGTLSGQWNLLLGNRTPADLSASRVLR